MEMRIQTPPRHVFVYQRDVVNSFTKPHQSHEVGMTESAIEITILLNLLTNQAPSSVSTLGCTGPHNQSDSSELCG